MNVGVNTVTHLFSGTPLSNWQNVLSQLPDDHIWDENSYQEPYVLLSLIIVAS
jgi:hypothetical protein